MIESVFIFLLLLHIECILVKNFNDDNNCYLLFTTTIKVNNYWLLANDFHTVVRSSVSVINTSNANIGI